MGSEMCIRDRLKRVFVSYTNTSDSTVDAFRHPTGAFSFQMRISSKMIPENAIEDDTTAFYQLHKALGSHKDATRSINIDKAGYSGTKYLLCLSTEKAQTRPVERYQPREWGPRQSPSEERRWSKLPVCRTRARDRLKPRGGK